MSDATMVRNVGTPAEAFGAAKNVFALWLASVPVSVPLDVTGEPETVKIDGNESPTLVTYESAGMSELVRARNVGIAAPPLDGPANTRFGLCVFNVAVSVPLNVTGEFETEKIEGIDKPTLATVPFVAGAAHVGTPPTSVSTCVFDPVASQES